MIKLDLRMDEMFQVSLLLLQQKQERLALLNMPSGRPSHPMYILLNIKWRIKLHNPINFGNIESSGGNIRAKQHSRLHLTELKESGGPFLLFLLAVDIHDAYIDVVEQIGVELDAVAT